MDLIQTWITVASIIISCIFLCLLAFSGIIIVTLTITAFLSLSHRLDLSIVSNFFPGMPNSMEISSHHHLRVFVDVLLIHKHATVNQCGGWVLNEVGPNQLAYTVRIRRHGPYSTHNLVTISIRRLRLKDRTSSVELNTHWHNPNLIGLFATWPAEMSSPTSGSNMPKKHNFPEAVGANSLFTGDGCPSWHTEPIISNSVQGQFDNKWGVKWIASYMNSKFCYIKIILNA